MCKKTHQTNKEMKPKLTIFCYINCAVRDAELMSNKAEDDGRF